LRLYVKEEESFDAETRRARKFAEKKSNEDVDLHSPSQFSAILGDLCASASKKKRGLDAETRRTQRFAEKPKK